MIRHLKFFAYWFVNTYDALFNTSLSWSYRWRLLALQPLTLLTYSIKYVPYMLSSKYYSIEIPTRGNHKLRAIVFKPKDKTDSSLHPIHVDFHGGAFLGGIAEYDVTFCEHLCSTLGAVVVSAQYRRAPVYTYPAAHEDAEDVVDWVIKNARDIFNADPETLTVSGSSAGANLMMTAGKRANAAVGICPLVGLRIPPGKKPKPAKFPTKDPLQFLMPLFDAYAAPVRDAAMNDTRLNPILKDLDDLPDHMLFIVAAIDILQHEQLSFIERLKQDAKARGMEDTRGMEAIVFDKGFHGWLELPLKSFDEDRKKAYGAATEFILQTRNR